MRAFHLGVAGALAVACSAGSSPFAEDAGARDAGADTAPADAGEDVARPTLDVAPLDRPPGADVPTAIDGVIVYAHTAQELFAVDPRTLAVSPIGTFGWPSDGHRHEMTDIAVTSENEIWGVTFDALYRVDRATARCALVAGLSGDLFFGRLFNALTFVPAGRLGSREVLVAATREGEYFQVDTTTGRASRLGAFSMGAGSSGDLVSVEGAGTFGTVVRGGTEYLARVDERSGAVNLIGATGVVNTWGLGYWRSRLYGFTDGGEFVTLDIATGRATAVSTADRSWWGAGVTTIAPTAPP